jgi:hypothetical protein
MEEIMIAWEKESAGWAERLAAGTATLEEIGEENGLTRERIRQIVKEHGHQGVVAAGRKKRRAEQREAEKAARAEAQAERVRLAKTTLSKGYAPPGMPDDEVIASLREWLENGGNGKASWWDLERDPETTISSIRISQRFGWAEAIRKAGGKPTHYNYGDRIDKLSRSEIVAAVVAFLTDPDEELGGAGGYFKWHRSRPQYPSLGTVRARFGGSWREAKRAALDVIEGRAPMPDPDSDPRPPRPVCSVDGCERMISSQGYCGTHKARIERSGDPLPDVPVRPWARYTDADIIAALRAWDPPKGKYSSSLWTGRPSLNTIYGHFGSWSAALDAAGIER